MMRTMLWTSAGAVWLLALAGGFWLLWSYEGKAGPAAQAPITWPSESRLPRPTGLPTLVVLMHPHCPCSRASVEELAKLMTACHDRLATLVLVVRPEGAPANWEQTDLWRSAAAIPGVSVMRDEQGAESRRFGASTSGQALLYSAEGKLIFSGGITESRGHSGDNEGRSTVVSLVLHQIEAPRQRAAQTPVFGCPLFGESVGAVNNEGNACSN